MCAVSNVGDYFKDTMPIRHPWYDPRRNEPIVPNQTIPFTSPSRQEFEALKNEVQELKKLLEAAKAYDTATGQHECEMDEKIKFIKQVADFVGVDLEEVFKK